MMDRGEAMCSFADGVCSMLFAVGLLALNPRRAKKEPKWP